MRKMFLFGDRFLQVDVLAKEPLRVQITEGDEIREQVITEQLPAGEECFLLDDRYVSYFVTEGSAGIWVTLAGETFYFEKTKGQGGVHEETHGGSKRFLLGQSRNWHSKLLTGKKFRFRGIP